ncbi:MAG: hypothetical protein ACOYMN_18215 [Roseimicrobium sp.]
MPALKNPKHEAFACRYAGGCSATQAYRETISSKCSASSAMQQASVLLKNLKVASRVSELRKRSGDIAAKQFDLTRERWLSRLLSVSDKAEAAMDFGAATRCLREIGLAMPGWYSPEKQEAKGKLEIVIRKL